MYLKNICTSFYYLKMNKLKAENLGQMNMYLNYYEQVCIILCTKKDKVMLEYALGGILNNLFTFILMTLLIFLYLHNIFHMILFNEFTNTTKGFLTSDVFLYVIFKTIEVLFKSFVWNTIFF